MIKKYLLPFTSNTKIPWLITGVFAVIFLTSACHWDQDEEKIANNKVLLLKFDQETANFTEGREYKYYDHPETFTVSLSKHTNGSETITDIFYKERNALLLKTTSTPAPAEGNILIPEDFSPAASFERAATNDFITPVNGYKEITEDKLTATQFTALWSTVQSLVKVREYLKSNPDQQVQVFYYQPTADNVNNSSWFFILKN